MLFDTYKFKLTLTRPMLATNPSDPHMMDTHIIERQRKLILEKNTLNTEINKYLDAIPIAAEKGEAEVQSILDKLESITGTPLTPEERAQAIKGELESLKQTFKELDLKGTTVFFWNKEKNLPMIGDHMIYGFMKASSEAICRTVEKARAKILQSPSYTQSIINQHVRCTSRFITFDRDILRNEDGTPQYLQRSLRAITAQGPRVSLARSEVVPEGASLEFELKVLAGSPLEPEHLQMMFEYGEFTGLGQWRNAGNGMFTFTMESPQNLKPKPKREEVEAKPKKAKKTAEAEA
jgi:hypothetical protein